MTAQLVVALLLVSVASGRATRRRSAIRARLAGSERAARAGRARPSFVRLSRLGGGRRSARRRAALDAALPRFAESVARELGAGASVPDAFGRAANVVGGETSSAHTVIERCVASGESWSAAVESWGAEVGSDAVDQFVATILLTVDLGGAAAGAFDAVAAGLRDQAELADELRSLTSQARASATLLSGLPPLAALALAAIDPATGRFLVGTPLGAGCTGGSIVLTAVGWWWMRWLSAGVR